MNLALDQNQQILSDSVAKYLASSYDFEARTKQLASGANFSTTHWQAFADLGWLAIPFPEKVGGLGLGPEEIAIVMEQLGKALAVEPYLATVILGGLALLGDEDKAAEHLPHLIEGKLHLALAFVEEQARFNTNYVQTKAVESADGFTISGTKSLVFNGSDADYSIVVARTSGEVTDQEGITLFLVPAGAKGLSLQEYKTVDGFAACEMTFDKVVVSKDAVVGQLNCGFQVLEPVLDYALLAIGAEAVGCMEMINTDTVAYSKDRVQFGVPIGTFQVLQHRMVDMFMEYEQTKSLMYMASVRLQEGGPTASKAVSALKAQVGKAGRYIGQQGVQIHGGMGVTDELRIGHYFKRLTVMELMLGNSDYHLKRFASIN